MNLKRIVAAVLAIIMLLALAACGEVGQSGGDSSSEAISESDALAEARSYIKSGIGQQLFINQAMPSGAKSMSNIDAGSASCIGQNATFLLTTNMEIYMVTIRLSALLPLTVMVMHIWTRQASPLGKRNFLIVCT